MGAFGADGPGDVLPVIEQSGCNHSLNCRRAAPYLYLASFV